MEDDKIRDLFRKFDPELSSDFSFIDKLQHSLDAVESVKTENAELKRRSKKAIAIAAAAGFAVGALFSSALPYIGSAVHDMALTSGAAVQMLADNYLVPAWTIIGGTAVLTALNTYELSLSLMKRR